MPILIIIKNMKKTIPAFIIILTVFAASNLSCRKGVFAPENFQAGIAIHSSQVSTSSLIVRFDETGVGDSLTAGGRIQKNFDLSGVAAQMGRTTHFRVYANKGGTEQLIADSTILLHKGELPVFEVVYSDVLGMGGFISGTDIPSDSVRIRIVYHDRTAAKKFAALEWQIYQYQSKAPYVDTNNNVKILFSLAEDQYSTDFYIPVFKKDGVTFTSLYCRLKDPVTGNFLYWIAAAPVFNTNLQTSPTLGGGTYLFVSYDLTDNGSTGRYLLKQTILRL